MSSDTDLLALYSQRILALAADIPHTARLEAPDASVRKRAPLCGSTITVDVILDASGRVAQFGQDVKACALGQASAALLGENVLGRDAAELRRARDQLKAMLREGAGPPTAPFTNLEVLTPARDYSNRHASILLAFEATLQAVEEAQGK